MDNSTTNPSLAQAKNLLPAHVQRRRAGSESVPYLRWTSVTDLLDAAFTPEGWSAQAWVDWPPPGSPFPPLMRITINAGSASRTAHARVISVAKRDGTILQPVSDVEQLKDGTRWTVGADPYEVAERAALCRAAAMFGIRVPNELLPNEDQADAPPRQQSRPAPAPDQPPYQDGEQTSQTPPRGAGAAGPLEGEPSTFTMNNIEWRRTKAGNGFTAEVHPADFGGAVRLLVQKSKDGKSYGASAFDDNGPMKDIGWHNAATSKEAIAALEHALGALPF